MDAPFVNIILTYILQTQYIRRGLDLLRRSPATQQESKTATNGTEPMTTGTIGQELQDHESLEPAKVVETGICSTISKQAGEAANKQASLRRILEEKCCARDAACEVQDTPLGYDACQFEEETEEGYTNGECRLISVPDFGKDSVALMLRFELSACIKRAIEAQRFFIKAQAHAELQIQEIETFENTLHKTISDKNLRLDRALDELDTPEEEESEDEAIASLPREIEVLQNLTESMQTKKQIIENELRGYADELQKRQRDVTEYFDTVFTDASVVDLGDDEVEQIEILSLDEEYRNMYKDLYDDDEDRACYNPEPLTTEEVEWERKDATIRDPEQQARAEIEGAVWEAREACNHAEDHFDSRRTRRDDEWQDHRIAKLNGLPTHDASKEAFDLRWVVEDRRTTRALIEAEKALAKAKAVAADAGVEILEPEEYDIPQSAWEFPGHPVSEEKEVGTFVPDSVDVAWMEAIVGLAPTCGLRSVTEESSSWAPDVDYWDFHEVEIGDSESCVDTEYYRDEIDKWQMDWPAVKTLRSCSV